MPRLDRLWYVIDAETKGFEEGVLRSGQKLRSFTDYAAGHPLVVLGALGSAALVAGYKATQMAMEFEKSMRMVQTVTDTSTISMKQLSDGVLKTFESMPIASLDEMTKGLYDIISSGVPAAQAIEYLNVASKAAVGGVTSVATAVDGLTSATNAWAAQGLTAKQAADQMFQAVNKGKLTFEQVAGTIGEVAGAAAGLNVSMADVLAVQAQLTLSGYSAAEAMTAVRQMMQEIVHPTGQLQEQFPDLARKFTRARLEGEGLVQFLIDFQRESHGNGAAMSALFTGVQGQFGAMALLKDGGAGLVKMLGDVKNSEGAAADAAAIMNSSVADTEQVLKNKLHAELVRLGSEVMPGWTGAIRLATEALKLYNGEADRAYRMSIATRLSDNARQHPDAGPSGERNNDVLRVTNDLASGALDVTKFTDEQLAGLHRAFAQEIAADAGITADEFERMHRIAAMLPGYKAPDRQTATFDLLDTEGTRRQQAADAAAAAAKKASDARIAGLSAEGEQLARTVQQTAEAARQYKGYGDEATRAHVAQAGALREIAAAQEQAASATKELHEAEASHNEAGIAAANAKLKNALTLINDQHQVLTKAGEELSSAAKRASSARTAVLAAVDEYARQGVKSPMEEAETKIRQLETEARNTHAAFSELEKAAIRAGAAMMAARQSRELRDEVLTELVSLTTNAEQQALRAGELAVQQLREKIALSRTLSDAEKDAARRQIDQIDTMLRAKAVLAGLSQSVSDFDQASAERDYRNARTSLAQDKAGVRLEDRTPEVATAAELKKLEDDRWATMQQINNLESSGQEQSDAYREAKKQLLAIEQKILGVEQTGYQIELQKRQAISARIRDQAQAIQGTVQMVTQLAQAFGAMDGNVAGMLTSLSQIGSSIKPLMDSIDAMNTMKDGQALGSIGQVIGAAAPIVGGITTLMGVLSQMAGAGEDPRVLAAQQANTEALKELTAHIGDLAHSDISGKQLQGVAAAIRAWEQAAGIGDGQHPSDARRDYIRDKSLTQSEDDGDWATLQKQLAAAHMTMADLKKVAEQFGITLNTFGDVEEVLRRIAAADTGAYTDDFAGSLARLADQLRAYGVTDPTEKLRRTIAVLTDPKTGIPALSAVFGGGQLGHPGSLFGGGGSQAPWGAIDATTAEGAAEAIKRLQELLDELAAGQLTAADLGGASVDQTRQAILDMIDQLRGGNGASGTGGYNVSQTITETTGNHLAGLLATANAFEERTAIAVEAMAAGMGVGGAMPAVRPPLQPPRVLSAAAAGGDTADVVVQVAPGAVVISMPQGATASATAIAQQVTTGLVAAISQGLAQSLKRRKLAAGDTTL